jgi:hypothetical protein
MDVLSKISSRRYATVRAIGVLAILLLLLFSRAGATAAPTELQASENRVKAAFVYKFGDYIEWPTEAFDTPNSPLVIGVVGADALADELARIAAGHTIGGRPVAVRRLRYGDPLSGLHVIFIGRSDSRRVTAALEAIKGQPALTVTESADGIRLGSMINFVVVSDKVRFDVALASAEASRLKISSRLLAVARNVVEPVP